jgi:hypothetical protein
MRTYCGLLLGMLVVLGGSVSVARAGFLSPAWQGTSGTAFADWDFLTSANPLPPETFTNAYGTPQATISVGHFGTGYSSDTYPPSPIGGSNPGIWDVGRGIDAGYANGSITLTLPCGTSGLSGGYTDIWVQASYYKDFTGAPSVSVNGASLTSSDDSLLASIPDWGQWRISLTEWQFSTPQTSAQVVLLGYNNGTMFDEIKVDTQTVPEPATMTLVGIGVAALLARRRRR